MVSGYTLTTLPNEIHAATATAKAMTRNQTNNQQQSMFKQEIGTAHQLVEKIQTTGFYPAIKRKTEEEKERGTSQPSILQYKFHLFYILKVTASRLAKRLKGVDII